MQLKKNADGSYMSPWSVDWIDNDGKQCTDPIDINCHCYDPTKNQVLNLNVRVEFNNIFNRMILPNPIVTGNFAAQPTFFTSGPNTGLYSGGFGTYTGNTGVLNGVGNQRTGTFVARVTF